MSLFTVGFSHFHSLLTWLCLWGVLAFGPTQPLPSHCRSPNASQPTSSFLNRPPAPPPVQSVVFFSFLLCYLNSVLSALALSVSLIFFSFTSWAQTFPSASKLTKFGPYSPISDHCPSSRSSESLSPWLTNCWHSCPYEYLSFRWIKTDQDLALGEFL